MIEYKLTADQYDKIWNIAVYPMRDEPSYYSMKQYIKDQYNGDFIDEYLKVCIRFHSEKDLTLFLLKCS